MKGYPLVLLVFLMLGNVSASNHERDAGCGPGVYCGDSPDDDGDPCTPQPDDPRTPDYDEGMDDAPCGDFTRQEPSVAFLEPFEASPSMDLTGMAPAWYEDPRSVNCGRAPKWCESSQYLSDMAERGES